MMGNEWADIEAKEAAEMTETEGEDFQMEDKLTSRMMFAAKYIKGFFYTILLICAIYWGVEGSFLDFWDAFLWLVAFIFIELNIFQWHSETEEEREHVMKV